MIQDRTQLLEEPINGGGSERGGYESIEETIQDVTTPNLGKTKKLPQYITALTASIAALLAGMVLGWTSPIMKTLEDGKFNDIAINTSQMGWLGSFTSLGAMTMCIPMGFICDLIGRKKALLSMTIPFTTGWVLLYYSNSVFTLYIGRLICGMGWGAACVATPIYISEIAEKKVRGSLGSYFQLMISTGILLSYITGTVLSPKHFTMFCMCLPSLFFVLFVFQPESPVYLMKKGLNEQAKNSLLRLRGPEANVMEELAEIEGILKESGQTATSIVQTFRRYSNIKALLIAFAMMFFQQFCGINAIVMYSTDIFHKSGIKWDDNLCTIALGLMQVSGTLLSSFLVDRLGRRVLLFTSCFVAGLSTFTLAIYFTLEYRITINEQILNDLSFIPILALGIFMIMFAIGLGPLPWVIGAEIFPPEVKSMACSGASTLNMFLAFLITKFFLDVSKSIGEDSSFYFFTFCSSLGMLFTYFILPETKGRSIEDIQYELSL